MADFFFFFLHDFGPIPGSPAGLPLPSGRFLKEACNSSASINIIS
jgi:hypothetical protein